MLIFIFAMIIAQVFALKPHINIPDLGEIIVHNVCRYEVYIRSFVRYHRDSTAVVLLPKGVYRERYQNNPFGGDSLTLSRNRRFENKTKVEYSIIPDDGSETAKVRPAQISFYLCFELKI